MGKSPNTCLNIIACGKRSKQNKSKNNIGTENQRKDSKGKQRWSFKKGTTQHRVLSTTVISEPTPLHLEQEGMGSTVHDQSKQTMATSIEKTTVSMLVDSTTVMPTTAVATSVTDAVNSHTDVDRSMEESAAITIQAAVRGYLARRELCALKSLVKLQAYVRGHLVRRQAVGSLRCVRAIVRLQALVRARRVRLSEQGMSIQEKLQQIRQQNSLKGSESESRSSSALGCNSTFLSEKLSVNGFARQLLETAPKMGTLHIEYDPDKHNSGWKWLERWMSASPWESGLSMQPKNSSECQEKSESPQLPDIEAENYRHSLLSSTLGSVLDQPKAEAENSSFSSDNPKFSLRKTSNSTSDPVSDRPRVEFEKSVRSSRKMSNSTLVSVSDQLSRQLRMVSNSTLESVLDKHNVEAEAKKSVHSSGRVSYAKSDSVSNQPSMQWRKVANLASDSLLDQPKVEADNPQLSLRKISNSALDHILDQHKVEVEDTTCGLNNASNLKSGSVSDQLEAEAKKSILSLGKGSNSTMDSVSGRPTMLLRKESDSTLDSILSQEKDETENHQCNIRNVSNSTLDSVFEHPKIEAENHVCSMKKSLSDQLGVEDEKSMCASRKVSNSALDFIMNPSKVEVQNHQFSLATTSNSTFDSVADHPSLQLRNMSNLTSDSILDQPKVEVENTQLNLTKVPKLVLDSVSDQIKIENENPECSVKRASYSTFHSVSEQLEMTTESSKSTAKKSSYTAFEFISDQLEAEAENFACNLIQVSNSTAGSVLDQPGNASNSTLDSVSDQLEVGVEKPMYSSREVSHSTIDSVLDQPKVEVENPKNSLEKKSNLVIDSVAVQLEAEPENLMDSLKKASNSTLNSTSDHPGQQINMENSLNTASNVLVQQAENDQSSSDQSPRRHETVPVVQGTSPIQLSTTGPPESTKRDDALAQIKCAIDTVPTKHERLESTIKTNLEHSATDLKGARRRTSFGSGKVDHADNDSQGSPSVPHYMATTESAKAKFRAQRSTTSSPDLQDNNSAAKRRISLPDSHGKQNSGSPRTQRSLSQVLTTTKGNRVISPRDVTEKRIQNEWRR